MPSSAEVSILPCPPGVKSPLRQPLYPTKRAKASRLAAHGRTERADPRVMSSRPREITHSLSSPARPQTLRLRPAELRRPPRLPQSRRAGRSDTTRSGVSSRSARRCRRACRRGRGPAPRGTSSLRPRSRVRRHHGKTGLVLEDEPCSTLRAAVRRTAAARRPERQPTVAHPAPREAVRDRRRPRSRRRHTARTVHDARCGWLMRSRPIALIGLDLGVSGACSRWGPNANVG